MKKMHHWRSIASKVRLSKDWLEYEANPPLVGENSLQEIALHFDNCRYDTERDELLLPDGSIAPVKDIDVEIVDMDKTVYPLQSGSFGLANYDTGLETWSVSRVGFRVPRNKSYSLLRIRANDPFLCDAINWHDYNLK